MKSQTYELIEKEKLRLVAETLLSLKVQIIQLENIIHELRLNQLKGGKNGN